MFTAPSAYISTLPFLQELPLEDRRTVLRESVGGDGQMVILEVGLHARQKVADQSLADLPTPAVITDPNDQMAWRAAVLSGTQAPLHARTLDDISPQLVQPYAERARKAAVELPNLTQTLTSLQTKLASVQKAAALRLTAKGYESAASLKHRQTRLTAGRWALVGVELLSAVAVSASFLGIMEYPSLALVPGSVKLEAFWVGLSIVPVMLGLPRLASRLARGLQLPPPVRVALLVAAVAAMLLLVGSMAVLRAASVAEGQGSIALGSWAILVIGGLSALVCQLLLEHFRLASKGLASRFAKVTGEEDYFAKQLGQLEKELTQTQEQVRAAEAAPHILADLRAKFEAAVTLLEQRLQEAMPYIVQRILKATAVWRLLQRLTPEEREYLLQHLAVHEEPTQAPEGPRGSCLGSLFSLLFLVALPLAFAQSGCAAPPPAVRDFTLICDGTGAAPAEVCTEGLPGQAFCAWADTAFIAPGATFSFITTAGAFGEVPAPFTLAAPSKHRGNIRVAKPRWCEEGAAALAARPIPRDTEQTRQLNKSDLLSALLVAAREARLEDGRANELLVASDLWAIGYGFNFERGIPSVEEVRERLRTQGITLDLSTFSTITLCGAHGQGATAERVAARDRFWTSFIQASCGPRPTILSSCRGLYAGDTSRRLQGTLQTQVGGAR